MPLLLKYWRYIAVLLLCLACYMGGRQSVHMQKTVTQEHTSEKIAEKKDETINDSENVTDHYDKVTTITKKKDGTEVTQIVDHSKVTEKKIEKIQDDTQTQKTIVQDKKTETETPVAADPYRPNYRLGFQAHTPVTAISPDYSVEVGYRLLGNMWGVSSYDIQRKEIGIGLSIDF